MERMNRNSLKALEENRHKGQFTSGERAVNMGKLGKIESDKVKAENKQKALEREEVVNVLTRVFNAPADKTTAEKLEMLNLPNNLLSKTLYNAVQKAGVNSNMLRVLLELINALSQQQTNVTVNNTMENPVERLNESELRALAEKWQGEKGK